MIESPEQVQTVVRAATEQTDDRGLFETVRSGPRQLEKTMAMEFATVFVSSMLTRGRTSTSE